MNVLYDILLALQGQVKAGYVIRYGGPLVNDFYFLTVNGAGHMVPTFVGLMCTW